MSTSDTTTKTVRRMFSEGPRVNSGLMEGSPVDASRLRYRAARGPAPRRGRRDADQAVLSLFDHKDVAAAFLDHFERLAAAARDAGERVLRDHRRQARLLHQQAVEVTQQRAAAGQHHAALGDIGAEVGRGLFERGLDRADDAGQRVLQRLEDFIAIELVVAWLVFGEVAALHLELTNLLRGIGGADLVFDLFGGGFADQRAVIAAHVVGDGLIEAVAADAHRGGVDDAVERNDGDLGRTAADVEHHRAARLTDRHAGADRRGHGFFEQIDFARASACRRFLDRAPFDLRRSARHADQHARARVEVAVLVHLVDEVLEHLLGDGAGRAADHGLRLGADRGDGLRAARAFVLTHGDHRGFVQHDALAAYINKSVGRT